MSVKDIINQGTRTKNGLHFSSSKVLDNLSGDADESELEDGPGSDDIIDGPVLLANRWKEVLELVGTESGRATRMLLQLRH